MLLGVYEKEATPWAPRRRPSTMASRSCCRPDRSPRRIPRQGLPALSGARESRDPAHHQRAVHVHARTAIRSSARSGACGTTGRVRRHGGIRPGGRRRADARAVDDSTASPTAMCLAMDVARFGPYATSDLQHRQGPASSTHAASRSPFRTRSCRARRPLLTTPIYDRLTAANAVWGATFGLEHALWFQEAGLEPKEDVTFRRSNAWAQVAAEVAAVRERVGMTEISNLRQVPGHRARRGGVAVVAADRTDAGARPDHPDRDAQRRGPDRRRVHGRPRDRRRRVLPVRLAAGRGPPLALVPPPPAGRRVRRGSRCSAWASSACPSPGRMRATCWQRSRRTSTCRPRRSRS